MISRKFISEDEYEFHSLFDLRINRLVSTLKGRINLLNLARSLVEKNYIPLTLNNIKIDITSEEEIESYLLKNTKYVESFLSGYMNEWFLANGTDKQKKRVLGIVK